MGRNAGTASILASGTVGGAIEAVVLGKRAISVSFAYDTLQSCYEHLKSSLAIDTACHLIQQLCDSWKESPELFNINIPLVLEYKELVWSTFHPGGYTSLFEKKQDGFVFSPTFGSLHGAQQGSDIWCILNSCISITPLYAKYHINSHDLTRYNISLL